MDLDIQSFLPELGLAQSQGYLILEDPMEFGRAGKKDCRQNP
jgi:hypothetical protein